MEGQKVVSTHSPFIAARCNLADIRHFCKNHDGPDIGRISETLTKDEIKKIEREIMNTRGELLFAKAVVLCEGMTEELMLPIFAEAHWGKSHFENGICLSGVGSGTNYGAFISFCHSFKIPWFIFGDGEADIVKRLDETLDKLGFPKSNDSANIILLPEGQKIGTYLVKQGYQSDLKSAIFELQKDDCANDQHRNAKKKEIERMDDKTIIQFLESNKTRIAPYIAEAIVQNDDPNKRVPSAFSKLFQEIDKHLSGGQNIT